MAELFANAAQSTLVAPISASDLTLTVASAVAFPTSGTFRLLIDSEILKVTAVAGTTFTVVRAAEPVEGTAVAKPHALGALATLVLTADSLAALVGPVTTAQSANLIFAGPSSGAAAVPGFRALVDADLPNLSPSPAGSYTLSALTVDVHGRVTVASSGGSSAITTALGYTPASSAVTITGTSGVTGGGSLASSPLVFALDINGLTSFTLPLAGTETVPTFDGANKKVTTLGLAAAAFGLVTNQLVASQPTYNGDIQAAVNALPTGGSGGGTVLINRKAANATWLLSKPLLIQQQYTSIFGDWSQDPVNLVVNFGAGPAIICMPTGLGPTLVTQLATGTGSAIKFAGTSSDGYYCLSDINTMRFDGASALSIEFYVNLDAAFSAQGNVTSSSGRQYSGGTVAVAAQVKVNASRQPVGVMTVGGTTYTLTGSSLTMTTGTTYFLALDYDSTRGTILLLGGLPGGTLNVLVTQAASGTVGTQQLYEEVTLGAQVQEWPEGGFLLNAIKGTVDSLRWSKVSRWSGAGTAPTAKLASDGNTLIRLNFDNFMADGGATVTVSGPVHIARNLHGNCYLAWRPIGLINGSNFIRLRNFKITGGFGGTSIGILMQGSTQFELDELVINNNSIGVKIINNCYNGRIGRIKLDGPSATETPSGVSNAVIAVAVSHASSNCYIQELEITTYAYGLVMYGVGLNTDYFRYTTGPATVCPMLLKSDGSTQQVATIHSLSIDDEPSGTPNSYIAGLWASGLNALEVSGGTIDVHSSGTANYCVKVGGTGVYSFRNVVFKAGSNTTAIFGREAATDTVELGFFTSVSTGTAKPWGDSGGSPALSSAFTLANTTLTATNINAVVRSGQSYDLDGVLQASNNIAAEGVKFDFAGGTATATTFFVAAAAIGTNTPGTVAGTALNTTLNYSALNTTNYVRLAGYLKTNTGGSFILRAAEDSTGGGGLVTLGAGSWLRLTPTVPA